MNSAIQIESKQVGRDHPTYFIADIAANYDGDLSRAKDLIQLAAEAGADAAKFQNFAAETIVSDIGFRNLGGAFSHQSGWRKSVFEVYAAASLPLDWTSDLYDTCQSAGIAYMTTPYDGAFIPKLAPYVAAWKIGSGDITWSQSIREIASEGKPVLLATGASDAQDVKRAMSVILERNQQVVLMQCNTNYTGSAENLKYISLNVLRSFEREYPEVVLGLSDHTEGHVTVLGAVALGARVVEKHFTDDRLREGPDHGFSLEPRHWREMVDRTRELELALGDHDKRVMENEQETVVLQRRAIHARTRLSTGSTLQEEDLVYLRPCPLDAWPPYRASEVIGRRLRHDLDVEQCIRGRDLE